MNSHSLMGIISSVVLLMPVTLMAVLKLFSHRSFLALAIYYFLISIQILMRQNVIIVPKWISHSFGIINNFLDAPLMLLFLTFFSISAVMTRRMIAAIFVFLGFEVIVFILYGFNVTSIKITLAPDIVLILIVSLLFFLRNVRLSITNQKALGKAVMTSAVLLSYIIFSLVYIFYFIIENSQYHADAELIYFLVIILSALLMSIGIFIENKRIKKLDDLKNTRKELATIYGEKKVAAFHKDSRFLNTGKF